LLTLNAPVFTGPPYGQFKPQFGAYITSAGVVSYSFGQINIASVSHTTNSGIYIMTFNSPHPLGSNYGVIGVGASAGSMPATAKYVTLM
jgi:hypothetical protein